MSQVASRYAGFLLALLAIVCSLCTPSDGSSFTKTENYSVSNIETVNDDLYLWANKINIDGVVLGDVSSFSFRNTITGEISQTANIFANEFSHRGKIDGSLRAFAQRVTIDGYVGRSAMVFAQNLTINSSSVIERDLTMFCSDAVIEGSVKGNVSFRGGRIELAGVVTGDVTLKADHISIVKPAVIIGNLTYVTKKQDDISIADGVTVAGQTIWKQPDAKEADKEQSEKSYRSLIFKVSSLLAAFLFGIIVVRLFRPYAEASFQQLRSRRSASFAAGLVGIGGLVLCIIVLIIALALMLVGFILIQTVVAPLGSLILIFSILMVPITGFLSITGTIIFYCGKIVLGYLIGYLLLKNIKHMVTPLDKSALFLGLVILTLLFSIPYLGGLLLLAASIIGAGAILLAIKNARQTILPGATSSAPAGMPPSPPPVTPPSYSPPPGTA